jgi:uncharacterized protein (DUF486 family)
MEILKPLILLPASTIFMTVARNGHLKFKSYSLGLTIAALWVAFTERS